MSDLTGTVRRVDLGSGLIAPGPGPAGWQIDRDGAGNVFSAADLRITRTDARSGETTVIGGNGTYGFCGDGLPATQACLDAFRVAYDPRGNLFILGGGRIRRVDAVTGVIETIAGEGKTRCPDGSDDPIPACDACLAHASGLAVDADGDVFFLDESEDCDDRFIARVRRIDVETGMVSTFAGRWGPCTSSAIDGLRATDVCLAFGQRLAFDPEGNLHLTGDGRVLRVDRATGTIAVVAGNGKRDCDPDEGEGGPATAACLRPFDLDLDGAGNLFVSERPHYSDLVIRVRRVDHRSGVITTVAGDAAETCTSDVRVPDGRPATAGCLGRSGAVAVDADGELYLSDYGQIRHVDATTGLITTVAGSVEPFSDAFLDAYDLALHAGRLVFPDGRNGQRVLGLEIACAEDACSSPSPAEPPSVHLPVCPLHSRRLCLTNTGCDDGDPCTQDYCSGAVCQSYLFSGLAGAACRAGQLAEATRCNGAGRSLAAKARKLRWLLKRLAVREEGDVHRAEQLLGRFRAASARRARRGRLPSRCAPPIVARANELVAILAEARACP